ncbi:MAG: hypothetical protein F4Y80_03535 [Caldilineaceae bacterium SB0665_bin_21]|nr:hypothetical protein [Caldilineaceae bacterium SB0665_bin_21]
MSRYQGRPRKESRAVEMWLYMLDHVADTCRAAAKWHKFTQTSYELTQTRLEGSVTVLMGAYGHLSNKERLPCVEGFMRLASAFGVDVVNEKTGRRREPNELLDVGMLRRYLPQFFTNLLQAWWHVFDDQAVPPRRQWTLTRCFPTWYRSNCIG